MKQTMLRSLILVWFPVLAATALAAGPTTTLWFDKPANKFHESLPLGSGRIGAMVFGGVINEHHGVGLKLGRIMKDLYGPAFHVLESIKKVLDPNNIMNPGKMGFPSKGL